ncbi:SCO0607 family lipoprotein [Streptomyces sp. NPDC020681]|uniref:SCO0607 family lipoprotein n=1 Tax=Streptomyces sp. NPDC020681 TaxID=3365083 RepID=UPI0037BD6E23
MTAFRRISRLRMTRPGKRHLIAAAVSATAVLALAGCSLSDFGYEEGICMENEYPTLAVGAIGGDCVTKGEEPPKGYVRYPEGKEPQKVDDKWDKYWDTHTVDKEGRIVEVPGGN